MILNKAISNSRGGFIGVAAFLLLWLTVCFIAFMTALGNDTPEARLVLEGVAVYALVANPLWGVPLSYLAGSYLILHHKDKTG